MLSLWQPVSLSVVKSELSGDDHKAGTRGRRQVQQWLQTLQGEIVVVEQSDLAPLVSPDQLHCSKHNSDSSQSKLSQPAWPRMSPILSGSGWRLMEDSWCRSVRAGLVSMKGTSVLSQMDLMWSELALLWGPSTATTPFDRTATTTRVNTECRVSRYLCSWFIGPFKKLVPLTDGGCWQPPWLVQSPRKIF